MSYNRIGSDHTWGSIYRWKAVAVDPGSGEKPEGPTSCGHLHKQRRHAEECARRMNRVFKQGYQVATFEKDSD